MVLGMETFAAAFGESLERRNASLSWLRDRLAARGHSVSLTTLSYWRSGDRVPTRAESLDALDEVEALLDVPAGSLTRLALQARRDRRTPAAFDALALGHDPGHLLGEQDVDRVLFHMTVDVDRGAQVISSTVTQIFVARRDGASGVSMFVGPDPDGLSNTSRVEALTGCRIGPVEDRSDGIRVVRLDFERPFGAGESIVTQTRVVDAGAPEAECEYGIVAEQKLEECMVLVRFLDGTPAHCWLGYQEGDLDEEWPVDLTGQSTVHLRETGFGPGVCRIRWEW